jgi:hypothetical protein
MLGPLKLSGVAEGHYRKLEPFEVAQLRRAVERAEKAPRPPARGRVRPARRRPRKGKGKEASH